MASNKFNVALLGSVTVAAMMAAGPVLADEVSDLKAQIEALSQKVQNIETQKSQPAVIPANVVTGGDFPRSFKLPGSNTSLKFGGYVKLDAIYDFDQKGGDASGGIAVDSATTQVDQNTGHFQMSARQTRFSFDSRTASEDMGTVRAYLEVDFNSSHSATETVSNSHNPRLRQAFVSVGPWLFGQTWGTFINLGAFVESIDFGGPVGGLLIRQAMIRYTQKFGATQLQLAIENPQNRITGGTSASGERDRLPDFVARISHGGDWGHISLAGVVEYLTSGTGEAGGDDNAVGYAGSLGGRINVWGKDNLKWQISGGDGAPRYGLLENINNGANNVYDTNNNEIDTVKFYGGYLGYQHHWNSKWRSNLIGGASKHRNPDIALNTVVENARSVHANVIYNATSKTNIGLEYIYKGVTVENGDSGSLSRVQFFVQHSF